MFKWGISFYDRNFRELDDAILQTSRQTNQPREGAKQPTGTNNTCQKKTNKPKQWTLHFCQMPQKSSLAWLVVEFCSSTSLLSWHEACLLSICIARTTSFLYDAPFLGLGYCIVSNGSLPLICPPLWKVEQWSWKKITNKRIKGIGRFHCDSQLKSLSETENLYFKQTYIHTFNRF